MTIHDTDKVKAQARDGLRLALARESWEWLQNEDGELAARVEACVDAGWNDAEIYRLVLGTAGVNREGLAKRCQLAAWWLQEGGA